VISKLILIVEDNKMVAEIAALVLKNSGYSVIVKDDYHTAIDCISNRSDIALLFTDILLPNGRRGTEVARFARDKNKQLPIIFTTAFSDQDINSDFPLSDNVLFIQKPYRPSALKEAVRNLI
jgi:CheY-like chemotaxis protein